MSIPGNYIDNRAALRQGVDSLYPGFTTFTFFGIAAITIAPVVSVSIADAAGNPLIIPASVDNPAYLNYCSFNLPVGLVADISTRMLKLAPLATTAAGGNTANSAQSGQAPFAYTPEAVRSASVPGNWVTITANTPFSLFSVDNTGLIAAGTVAAPNGTVYVDVEVVYIKRKPAIKATEALRSNSDAYKAAGVAAGFI